VEVTKEAEKREEKKSLKEARRENVSLIHKDGHGERAAWKMTLAICSVNSNSLLAILARILTIRNSRVHNRYSFLAENISLDIQYCETGTINEKVRILPRRREYRVEIQVYGSTIATVKI
jgi:hypothetical protein